MTDHLADVRRWYPPDEPEANIIADLWPEWPHDISTPADADHALKTIAVAEAAETVWARAKDAARLFDAIKAKLHNQAAYAVWRQDVAVPSQARGVGRGVKRIVEQRSALPDADPGKDVIARWRKRLCAKVARHRWRIDETKLSIALEDAHQRCVRICEQENIGTIRGTEGTGEFERYTPAFYIAKAREVLGEIDLDPATSEQAQATVKAAEYFTVTDNGLQRDWHGRVWLNPPYHRDLAPAFVDKLLAELAAGRVAQAIMLTNNVTDTGWFQAAAATCEAVCFTAGRIHFEVPGGPPVLPTQGQAFLYFGPHVEKFVAAFTQIGFCMGMIK